jgi:hypothetical protein
LLTDAYFAVWILFALREFFHALDVRGYLKRRDEKVAILSAMKDNEEKLKKGCSTLLFLLFSYTWLVLGFFTSFWLLFVAYFALSLITAPLRKIAVVVWLDAVLSGTFLMLVVLNWFHLHYTQQQILDYLFQ